MTRIFLTTATALGLAAPAFAGTVDVVRHHFAADDTGIESRVVEGSATHTQRAVDILVSLAAENDGNERAINVSTEQVTVSSKGGVNGRAQAIFAEMLVSEDAADK